MPNTIPKSKDIIIWLITGSVAGCVSSLIGIGGGIIFVPALHIWSGFPLKRAIATSVACIVAIAAVGAASHGALLPPPFPWKQAVLLAATAVITAQLGAIALRRLPTNPVAWAFGTLLAVSAARILFDWTPQGGTQQPDLFVYPIIGLVSGFASSLLGIGGGVIVVGLLVGLLGAPMVWSVTLSLTAMVPTTVSGLIAHAKHGLVHWPAVPVLTLPALGSAYLGAQIAHRVETRWLEWLFCAFCLYAVYRLLSKTRANRSQTGAQHAG